MKCDSCGAPFKTYKNYAVNVCLYCKNSQVIAIREENLSPFDQRGQTVGHQTNITGVKIHGAKIDGNLIIGDVNVTGDYVRGVKSVRGRQIIGDKVGGDTIIVGDIPPGSKGVAIGRDAFAVYIQE